MNKLSVIAAVAAMSFAAPAMAATAGTGLHRMVVSSAGLDLATAKGQRMLDLRIMHAASSLCGTPSPADALGWKSFKQCVEAAKAGADEQRRSALASAIARHNDTLTASR